MALARGRTRRARLLRLLIADDHALLRTGMRAVLAREPDLEVAGEAENGREAVDLYRKLCPDVVLMDISMPEMDGISATQLIRAESPNRNSCLTP